MKKVAFVLSGCGYLDGSELYEAIFSIEIFKKNNCEIIFFAPKDQLKETELITRDNPLLALEDLSHVMDSCDILFFPGGYGVVKKLSNYLDDSINPVLYSGLKDVIIDSYKKNKIIGALCIAPIILAIALGDIDKEIVLTLGDLLNKRKIEDYGLCYKECDAGNFVQHNNIFSSPAFMISQDIIEIKEGVEKMITKMII